MGEWCLFDQRVVFGKRKSIYCKTLIAECGMYLKMLQKLEFDLPRLSSKRALKEAHRVVEFIGWIRKDMR